MTSGRHDAEQRAGVWRRQHVALRARDHGDHVASPVVVRRRRDSPFPEATLDAFLFWGVEAAYPGMQKNVMRFHPTNVHMGAQKTQHDAELSAVAP